MLSRTDNQQINGGSARGISPFLLNKRKLRSGNSFSRENNGDITAENKSMYFFHSFEINIVILIQPVVRGLKKFSPVIVKLTFWRAFFAS